LQFTWDDILVFTSTQKQHTTVVREVLKILRDNNLFLKPEKCVFHQSEVEYLGLIVGTNKPAWTLPKISAIRDWPVPRPTGQFRLEADKQRLCYWRSIISITRR